MPLLTESENKDARVEHLVGSWLLQEGPVRSSMLFLTLVTSQIEILNRRDVLPWYLYSHLNRFNLRTDDTAANDFIQDARETTDSSHLRVVHF